jgi:hypothetical protein
MLISLRISRIPEESSSADPNCRPWRQLLICPNKKKSEGAKFGEYGQYGGCGAIRKKLPSQNTFVTFTVGGLALFACTTNLLSPLSMPSNDLSENISDIVGGPEHLSFSHGINNLESTGIPDEC